MAAQLSPIIEEPLTPADRRALKSQASVEERRRDEHVNASLRRPRRLLTPPANRPAGDRPIPECSFVVRVSFELTAG
jgi:hypothetical protein